MNVPFLDLHAQYESVKTDIDRAIGRVLKNARFIGGAEVESFERRFAEFIGVRASVGLNSGTDALVLGVRALGLSGSDEIIIPANTFYSTALAATENNLRPVFADIDPHDNGYDLSDLKKKMNARTKAVIVVHMHGQPDNVTGIARLIRNAGHKIYLIEDACQAHGALYGEKRVGSFGYFGAFSFYPSKNLGAYGDGGAVTTDSPQFAKKLRMLREYGQTVKYRHRSFGVNSRLDTLQAAVLLVKLMHLDRWNKKRQTHAARYSRLLAEVPQVTVPPAIPERPSIYHVYAIRSPQRDRLKAYLAARGITTQIHYPIPLHRQSAFKKYGAPRLPNAERAARLTLSLPMYPELTDDQIDFVALQIKKFRYN